MKIVKTGRYYAALKTKIIGREPV